jgi:hypothetical protein
MSVWERNSIWYYQFRYRGKQYSGRAGDAQNRDEARIYEQGHKQDVIERPVAENYEEAISGRDTQAAEKNEGKVNICVDERLLKHLLESAMMPRVGEGEIATKDQFIINWRFIIAVAAGVFIGKLIYGIVSILATSWISFQ